MAKKSKAKKSKKTAKKGKKAKKTKKVAKKVVAKKSKKATKKKAAKKKAPKLAPAPAEAGLASMMPSSIGGLFAYFRQTYQTGADAWQLFALWAALGLPLCLGVGSVVPWAPWEIKRVDLESEVIRQALAYLQSTGKLPVLGNDSATQQRLFT